MTVNYLIEELITYGVKKELISEYDRAYVRNGIMDILGVSEMPSDTPEVTDVREIDEILDDICDYATESGIIEGGSIVIRDLFDTKIMGLLTERPSSVIKRFYSLYENSPKEATDWFYKLSCDTNYIRTNRVKKDLKWKHSSEYGDMDITVNLSKPEKDPKAIARAKSLPQSGYPKCLLCHENEGFSGNINKPARQNLRQIPFDMAGTKWYLQYSPYVYYNEHCIALSSEHTPMKIDSSSFRKLLDFVSTFPHYFIGSNADLPIVGGSILSHDHMQGGRYSFAMERAEVKIPLVFKGFGLCEAGILKWPLSVIRLRSADKEQLVLLATKILAAWREYTDKDAGIHSHTKDEPHNTITPIARRCGEKYELDLVLRNNRTTSEYPLGIFHPHAEHHNIKKENIGLIEVMGLAVLPSRLKEEISLMKWAILTGRDFAEVKEIEKHKAWFENFKDGYTFTEENTEDILKEEIGKTFVRVLLDAGVYKDNEAGERDFIKFIDYVNSKE